MKVLFADSVDDCGPDRLRAAGHDCTIEPGLSEETLPGAIGDHDALVVRSTRVTAEAIGAGPHLGLIVRAGAGTDNIDSRAASARGVYVCNVPGRNAIAVAELTLGLLLAVDRRIPHNVADLRAGEWNKREYAQADGLYGKRLGIIGLGDIGLAVAERARAFGLTVAAIRRPNRSAEAQSAIRTIGIRLLESVDDLLAESDIVSLHVPKAPETVGLVDRKFLSKAAARSHPPQHRPGRRRRRGSPARRPRRRRPAGRAGRVAGRARCEHRAVRLGTGPPSPGCRHPPHRGLDRPGPALRVGRGGRRRRVLRRRIPDRLL